MRSQIQPGVDGVYLVRWNFRYVGRARSEKGFPSQGHYLKFTNGRWRLFLLENNLLQGTLMWWKTIFLSWRNIWYSLQEMWIAGRTWFISHLEMMSREMPHFLPIFSRESEAFTFLWKLKGLSMNFSENIPKLNYWTLTSHYYDRKLKS